MIEIMELVKSGGPWAVLCGWLIFKQDKRQSALENWVRETVITCINDNTAVMKENIEVMRSYRGRLDNMEKQEKEK